MRHSVRPIPIEVDVARGPQSELHAMYMTPSPIVTMIRTEVEIIFEIHVSKVFAASSPFVLMIQCR